MNFIDRVSPFLLLDRSEVSIVSRMRLFTFKPRLLWNAFYLSHGVTQDGFGLFLENVHGSPTMVTSDGGTAYPYFTNFVGLITAHVRLSVFLSQLQLASSPFNGPFADV